ncbi:MAG: type II secretion system protein GspD [Chlamydiales bacterium]
MIRVFVILTCCFSLAAQTIAEKRELLNSQVDRPTASLGKVNEDLRHLRRELNEAYTDVKRLHEEDAEEEEFQNLLQDVKQIRQEIDHLENEWLDSSVDEGRFGDEGYALWDQDETTLSALVMEYGSSDYLYLIPPEMASMKINMHSSIPIPRESWGELLEVILQQNGVGVKKINNYARQLFVMRQNLITTSLIATRPEHLERAAKDERIVYIFSPAPDRVRGVANFFDRFRDPKRTFIYQVSQKIAIIAPKEDICKLLALHDAVFDEENTKVTRIVPFTRMNSKEMEKVLKAHFNTDGSRGGSRLTLAKGTGEGLTIVSLAHENAIALIGMKETVEAAEQVIRETDEQLDDPCEMTVFWYNCRHSDPTSLSDVLEKVYESLICAKLTGNEVDNSAVPKQLQQACNQAQYPSMPQEMPTYGPPPCPPMIQPPVVQAGSIASQEKKSKTTHFIPYDKTGAIMMVVRKDTLPELKKLVKKLDVPKKMVQIEVLLFERRIKDRERAGLNLLKLGDAASQTHSEGLTFDARDTAVIPGLLDFFFSRKKSSSFPAYDLAYSFLLNQENIHLNSAPSVTTINQTPATISIVDEISINNGAAPLNTADGQVTFEKSFSRAQFGTTIVVTPTVHEPDLDMGEEDWYITLETNVDFDNITSDLDDRPDVIRRHIENVVRVVDGETIILGGLRRKKTDEKSEKIPFLGEIPGIAKLFGSTKTEEDEVEMFLFITPKIIIDPRGDVVAIREVELMKRAGDIPEYLDRLCESLSCKKQKVFQKSWNLFFGNNKDQCYDSPIYRH